MISSTQIRSVHLEVTDKCNANCPMCARTHHGGKLNPYLRNIEMSLETAQKVFPPAFVKQLGFLQMCGSFGDPIVAKDMVEILKYLRSENPKMFLGVHTNGSARTEEWWSDLGGILSKKNDYCKFGLDGLEDTNAIYRQNTSWHKIMTNAKSFIAAGGIAHWEFLVFKHNEHQVEEARELSKKMGFKEFYLKKTARFYNYQTGKNDPFPILNKNDEVIGQLEPPTSTEHVNAISLSPPSVAEGIFDRRIDCSSAKDRSIYVSAAGEIFPCCFLGGQMQYIHRGSDGAYLESLSKGQIAVTDQQKIEQIIDGPWFKAIEKSWSKDTPVENKINSCYRICGKNQNIVKAEYT